MIMVTGDWFSQIHERLLAGDATAPAELIEMVLEGLSERLSKKHPKFRGTEMLADALTDALMDYVKRPAQFDPLKGSLPGFLLMAADRDLLNAFAKAKRRMQREIYLEDVELAADGGNLVIQGEDVGILLDSEDMWQEIKKLFSGPKDSETLRLMLEGERSTEAFVKVLGLDGLTLPEQRRQVKQHKDRIAKRIERYGKKINKQG
jgi:hypothetical protein